MLFRSPILVAIGAGILLLLLVIILLLIRSHKKKKQLVLEGDELEEEGITELAGMAGMESEEEAGEDGPRMLGAPGMNPEDDEFTKNEEILNLKMQRSLRLKQNIGDFVDQNPQIAAKLIQSWLRGEEGDSGERRNRKQPR